ncbi:MAG: divergent polysaccharide deacetylase family protein [Candidatus Cloacimonetes bacterium]|nr:divergent polysaccharide deacetylase family protein [Candidatus Cloacimonadota bacterium]
MGKRKSIKNSRIDRNYYYILLFIGFILLLFLFNYDKIKNLVNGPQQKKDKVSIKQKREEITVLDVIVHAKLLLGVTEENYKNHIGEDAIYISIGVDRSEMDLNYANIIITGQVELIGGKIIKGEEKNNGNKQVLEIEDPHDSQIYFVTLYYTKSRNVVRDKTLLAIVVDDFGIRNNKLLDDFCSLNSNVTFAILPDQKYSKHVMNKATETGHETMIHIPMEPISYPRDNPGANAIYVHLSANEIKRRMENYIKQFPLCVGANNHMGSFATTDESVMRNVLQVLKDHNLYFVDSRTSQSSIAYDVAKKMMIPTCENQIFLDTPRITEKTLANKIRQLKYLAKDREKILVITHCATQDRYEFLKEFIKEIEKLDFELVPVSELFKSKLPEII